MWMISLLGPNWTILSAVVSRSQNIILLAGLLREYKVSKNALIGLYFFPYKRITHFVHDLTVRPSQNMLSDHLFLTLIKRNCWMDLTTANPSAGWGRPDSDRIMEIMTLKLLSDWREWLILSNIHRVRNYQEINFSLNQRQFFSFPILILHLHYNFLKGIIHILNFYFQLSVTVVGIHLWDALPVTKLASTTR